MQRLIDFARTQLLEKPLAKLIVRTITCTLTFPEGAKLTAKASARLEKEEARVDYSGAVYRAFTLPDKATLGFLQWYMEGTAANLGAEIEVKAEGEFDGGHEGFGQPKGSSVE